MGGSCGDGAAGFPVADGGALRGAGAGSVAGRGEAIGAGSVAGLGARGGVETAVSPVGVEVVMGVGAGVPVADWEGGVMAPAWLSSTS